MVRTQNPTAHAVRRDSFVDAAQGFIQSKGYEQMSIQDVLDELGASKGAFYHYFDSKQALLQAVVDRMVDAAVAAQTPLVMDPTVSAPEKIHGLFAGISRYKNARPELMTAILETWMSDDNAVVRERVWRGVSARLTPMLAEIVRQGNTEGHFDVGSPDDSAAILMALTMGLNQRAIELYVARQAGTITLEDVERTIGAYVEAFDRVLAAPPGSVVPVDLAVVRQWFGKQEIAT
jgi:AcrR family transcriptional regulator